MKSKIISFRQGDVLTVLESIDKIPAGAVEVKTEQGRVVLAYGEVTGHAHAIYEQTSATKMWAIGKVKYLEVMAHAMVMPSDVQLFIGEGGEPREFGADPRPGVALKHEEHTIHIIPPGLYKLPVQVEYTPAALQVTRD